ncbi:hypothetical protein VULLAG_LOCUS392 [Vulpes lagopus]
MTPRPAPAPSGHVTATGATGGSRGPAGWRSGAAAAGVVVRGGKAGHPGADPARPRSPGPHVRPGAAGVTGSFMEQPICQQTWFHLMIYRPQL